MSVAIFCLFTCPIWAGGSSKPCHKYRYTQVWRGKDDAANGSPVESEILIVRDIFPYPKTRKSAEKKKTCQVTIQCHPRPIRIAYLTPKQMKSPPCIFTHHHYHQQQHYPPSHRPPPLQEICRKRNRENKFRIVLRSSVWLPRSPTPTLEVLHIKKRLSATYTRLSTPVMLSTYNVHQHMEHVIMKNVTLKRPPFQGDA